ncbi:hypothetical protein [Mycoplasma sp. SG1]|uniref:hypothetical protein n=1 Tax=Mycoplasma sp. SG1 TaxID=2810348 RepID=UPI002024E226|nr:hypothetical protein [Mycoplasma sp. SG1]URM53083.1 hypothetical protein JRW51_01915 [Mycoplasma sp. SG1]
MSDNNNNKEVKDQEQGSVLSRTKKLEKLHNTIENPTIDKIDNLNTEDESSFFQTLDLNLKDINSQSKYEFNNTLEVYGTNYKKQTKQKQQEVKAAKDTEDLNQLLTSEIDNFSHKLQQLKNNEENLINLNKISDEKKTLALSKNATAFSSKPSNMSLTDIIAELNDQQTEQLSVENKVMVEEYLPELEAKKEQFNEFQQKNIDYKGKLRKFFGFKAYSLKEGYLFHKSARILIKELNIYLQKNADALDKNICIKARHGIDDLKYESRAIFFNQVLHLLGFVVIICLFILLVIFLILYLAF